MPIYRPPGGSGLDLSGVPDGALLQRSGAEVEGRAVAIPAQASVLDAYRDLPGLQGYGRALAAGLVPETLTVSDGRLDVPVPSDVDPSAGQHYRATVTAGTMIGLLAGHSAMADIPRQIWLALTNSTGSAVALDVIAGGSGYLALRFDASFASALPTIAAGATEVFLIDYLGQGVGVLREPSVNAALVRGTPEFIGIATASANGALTCTDGASGDFCLVFDQRSGNPTLTDLRPDFSNVPNNPTSSRAATFSLRASWRYLNAADQVIPAVATTNTPGRSAAIYFRGVDPSSPFLDPGASGIGDQQGTPSEPTLRTLPALSAAAGALWIACVGVNAGMATPPAAPAWGVQRASFGTGNGLVVSTSAGRRLAIPAAATNASAEATWLYWNIQAIRGALV